jgi:transcriptional regulator with XRE-family HTH domain
MIYIANLGELIYTFVGLFNVRKIQQRAGELSKRQEINQDPKEVSAARAVGAVVSFYRRARGKTQQQLQTGGEGVLTASALAMIEGGDRLPTEKALRFLCERLDLSAFQTEQLRNLAHDPDRTDEQRLQTIMPSDVIRGVALFMRPAGDDSALLESADVEEVWIVTKSPLTVKTPYYEMMRDRVTKGKLRFTYFLDSEDGKAQFVQLFQKMAKDPELDSSSRSSLPSRLRCIVVPTTLTIFGFVLFNPNVPGRMFGRSIVMDDYGLTIGVIPMDTPKVTASFQHLSKIVDQLVSNQKPDHSGPRIEHVNGIGTCELLRP